MPSPDNQAGLMWHRPGGSRGGFERSEQMFRIPEITGKIYSFLTRGATASGLRLMTCRGVSGAETEVPQLLEVEIEQCVANQVPHSR